MFEVYIILMTLILIIIKVLIESDEKNLPPGDRGWPIIGVAFQKSILSTDYLNQMAEKYGDIFCLKVGSKNVVFLNDYRTIKSAYASNAIASRPNNFTYQLLTRKQLGIAGSSDLLWRRNKQIIIRHFNAEKSKAFLEHSIELQRTKLLDHLGSNLNIPISFGLHLMMAVSNTMWAILIDKQFDWKDESFRQFAKLVNSDLTEKTGPIEVLDFFPYLEFILPSVVQRRIFKLRQIQEDLDKIMDFHNNVIDEHKQTLDEKNPRNFIDLFLCELKKEERNNKEPIISESSLRCTMNDWFTGGSLFEFFSWFVLYMALNPEVQQKAQRDLDHILKHDEELGCKHRSQLPYIEAIVNEVNRCGTPLPYAIPHATSETVKLKGYVIPKDTMVMIRIDKCHKDPNYWERPLDFYPEHFIDADGKLKTKIEGFMPFSTGKRLCLGESPARLFMFILCGSLLHKFKIDLAPNQNISTQKRNPNGYVSAPKQFKFVLSERMKSNGIIIY